MSLRVLLVGAGGLGSPAALALAAAPGLVSGLTLVDPDVVELSNLHRQVLHGEADLGRPKVDSARDRLGRIAPHLPVRGVRGRFDAASAAELLRDHDVVVEGSDSLPTKFLVNDEALRRGVPAVIGGVLRFSGQLLTVLPGQTACYRCLFEEPPDEAPSCQDAGVLGPACGVVGALQAEEVLRLCRGERPRFAGAVLVADLRAVRLRRVPLRRRPGCPACQARPAVLDNVT